MTEIGDDQNCLGAVQLCVDGFTDDRRVAREIRAGKNAVSVVFLRFVTKHQHDLAADIQAGIVVIAVFGRGNAVTGEHQRARRIGAG